MPAKGRRLRAPTYHNNIIFPNQPTNSGVVFVRNLAAKVPETPWWNTIGRSKVDRPGRWPWSTPQAIPRSPTMKGFPLQAIGKSLGVCSKGVLKQP